MTNLAIAFLRIEPQALGDIPGVRCVNHTGGVQWRND